MLTTLGLTKTVALEATEHGSTVNAICPGYVLTSRSEFQEGQGAEHNREASRMCCSTLNHAEVCDNARDRPGLVPGTAAASGLSIHPADIGWLLVACAPAQSGAILTLIQAAGFNEARIVGEMVEGSGAVVS